MSGIHCSIAGATYAAAGRTAKTVTAVGTAQVSTAQSKFGGASLILDDSPEAYLTVTHASDLATGTAAFTVEGWFRPQLAGDAGQGPGTRFWFFKGVNSATGFGLGVTTDGVRFRGPSQDDLVYTGSISSSAWTHIAFVYDGTNKKIYVNGTQQATAIASLNVTNSTDYQIGYFTSIFAYNGYVDEIRVSTTARYTTTFTPSATAFTNDSNTLLLLHCDGDNTGTTFVDDVGTNEIPRTALTVTASGNAQISTAQSKFGGASALFDGTTDYIQVDSAELAVGTGDFTFECWVRVTDTNAFMLFDQTNPTGSTNGLSIWVSGGTLNLYSGGWIAQAVGTINNNTWYHIAVSLDSSNNLKAFINGTQVGTTQTFTNNINQTILRMGSARIDAGYDGNGYMDEIRVSNIARYTANFTAPTAAFTNDRNTLLLIHCNGTNTQTTFFDDNIWANTVGNTYFTPPSAELTSDGSTIALWHLNSALTDSGPSALTLSTSGGYNTTTKKFGTASGDLSDSTTDFFARATTGHYWIYGGTAATGARQYTIEFWTYNTVFTNNSETDGGGFQLPLTFVTAAAGVGLTTTGKMTQNQFPSPRGSTTGVDVGADSAPTSQWVHQAYVIGNDMKWRGYLDGKLQFIQTAIDPSSIYTTATDIQIGRNSSSGTNANLMIDEIRLSSTKRYGS